MNGTIQLILHALINRIHTGVFFRREGFTICRIHLRLPLVVRRRRRYLPSIPLPSVCATLQVHFVEPVPFFTNIIFLVSFQVDIGSAFTLNIDIFLRKKKKDSFEKIWKQRSGICLPFIDHRSPIHAGFTAIYLHLQGSCGFPEIKGLDEGTAYAVKIFLCLNFG